MTMPVPLLPPTPLDGGRQQVMALNASTQALARLEPFLLLAKTAKGAAAARLIAEVTAAPGCYVFAELFDFDGVQALASDQQYSPSFRLLELFAYGTYSDYNNAAPGTFPALEPAQIEKLRQLTLVTCASRQRSLRYEDLLEHLGLTHDTTASLQQPGPSRKSNARSIRQLEDVIIESIYAGIITARFDQARSRVDVESAMGRDVHGDEGLESISATLHEWHKSTTNMMTMLQQHINDAQAKDQQKLRDESARDASMEETLIHLLGRPSKGGNQHAGGRAAATYDRMGSDRVSAGDVEMEEDPLSLRKKKSTSGGPSRSKRTRA